MILKKRAIIPLKLYTLYDHLVLLSPYTVTALLFNQGIDGDYFSQLENLNEILKGGCCHAKSRSNN